MSAGGTKLFVYGVSRSCPKDILETKFGAMGSVMDVYITEKGYAFVTMAEESDARAAVDELNGTCVDGQEIKVEMAHGRGTSKPRGGGVPRGRGVGGFSDRRGGMGFGSGSERRGGGSSGGFSSSSSRFRGGYRGGNSYGSGSEHRRSGGGSGPSGYAYGNGRRSDERRSGYGFGGYDHE